MRCATLAVLLLAACGGVDDPSSGRGEYPSTANICVRAAWLENACWADTDCETVADKATCYMRQKHPVVPEDPCGAEAPPGTPASVNSQDDVRVFIAEQCRDKGAPRWYCWHC